MKNKYDYYCELCGSPMPFPYEPKFCCNGRECSCMGKPIEPCLCSDKCWDATSKYIGIPMEERRIKAGIEKYVGGDSI